MPITQDELQSSYCIVSAADFQDAPRTSASITGTSQSQAFFSGFSFRRLRRSSLRRLFARNNSRDDTEDEPIARWPLSWPGRYQPGSAECMQDNAVMDSIVFRPTTENINFFHNWMPSDSDNLSLLAASLTPSDFTGSTVTDSSYSLDDISTKNSIDYDTSVADDESVAASDVDESELGSQYNQMTMGVILQRPERGPWLMP